MVMKRSISVNPSGWCWIDGLCWILRENSCVLVILYRALVISLGLGATLLSFQLQSIRFRSRDTGLGLSVPSVNTVLILHGTRACPSGEICTAFLNKRTWINKLRLFERKFTRYYRHRNRLFCVALARPTAAAPCLATELDPLFFFPRNSLLVANCR